MVININLKKEKRGNHERNLPVKEREKIINTPPPPSLKVKLRITPSSTFNFI